VKKTKTELEGSPVVKDYTIEDIRSIKADLSNRGFQATEIGDAVSVIRKMKKDKCTVYFTFTANMVASGLRGLFALLCRHKFVDVIITTPGALEHDVIKTYKPYLTGGFVMDDKDLHSRGINRIGNILVPNDRYVLLEEKSMQMLNSLYAKNKIISPSEIAHEFGRMISESKDVDQVADKENSFLYWAYKNNIPVFVPGITDGALGLHIYMFKQKRTDVIVDVTKDMKRLADITLTADKTGGIILGGGISKHHAIGVNIVRDGLDYAVYVTTAQPWDGSLSGARTTEAVSWGKVKEKAAHVTVDCDATVAFPLIVAGVQDLLK